VQVHSYTLPNEPLGAYRTTSSLLSSLYRDHGFDVLIDFEQALTWRKAASAEAVTRFSKERHLRLVYYFGNHYPWLVPKMETNPRVTWFFLKRLAQQADMVVTASSVLARSVTEKVGVTRRGIAVVPFGVDFKEYSPCASTERSGVIYVGRVIKHKGLDDLVRAASVLFGRGFHESFTVVGPRGVLWDDTPSDYFGSLVTKVESLGLRDKITFTGAIPRSEVIRRMRKARVFAFPSHAEGFGVALIQAMASGLVPAVYDFEPVSEVVGRAGFRAKPFEAESLAGAILQAHESKAGDAESLERAQRFSISRVADEFLGAVL
jgi:glycosyltransferase involved in cell wall biosynthesis